MSDAQKAQAEPLWSDEHIKAYASDNYTSPQLQAVARRALVEMRHSYEATITAQAQRIAELERQNLQLDAVCDEYQLQIICLKDNIEFTEHLYETALESKETD